MNLCGIEGTERQATSAQHPAMCPHQPPILPPWLEWYRRGLWLPVRHGYKHIPMSKQPMPGKRINIVGTSGCGKTTLASRLAETLDCPHHELDALAHGPNWTMTPDEEFRAAVAEFAAGERWVACGNYSRTREVLWPRADTIVWLDFPFRVAFGRVLKRTLHRSLTKEELWHGNRENLRTHFCTKDSLLLWVLKTYRHNRRKFPALFQMEEHAHLTNVVLRSPREAEKWLQQVRDMRTS